MTKLRQLIAQSADTTVADTVVAITATAVGFNTAQLAAATRAIISCRTAGIMFTYDGTDPTATLGIHIKINEYYSLESKEINKIKMLREASTSANVTIVLEK